MITQLQKDQKWTMKQDEHQDEQLNKHDNYLDDLLRKNGETIDLAHTLTLRTKDDFRQRLEDLDLFYKEAIEEL